MFAGSAKGIGVRFNDLFSAKVMTLVLISALLIIGLFVLINDSDSSDAIGETSGSCGTNLTWTYDSETHALTITGTGAMNNYDYEDVKWGGNDIRSVSLPDGLTRIGSFAFSECTSLTNITIPNSVNSIRIYAFYGCSSLESIVIPDSVTEVGYDAFYGCTSLETITIGSSVESIGVYAFYGCTALTSITVSPSNDHYSSQDGILFDKEKTLLMIYPAKKTNTSYTVPGTVTEIDVAAFSDSAFLQSVVIGDSVETMGNAVFDNCSSLVSVSIGNNVTAIGTSTFRGCSSLSSVSIGSSVSALGNEAFTGCGNLTAVILPNSVESIGVYAFNNCTSLESVTLSNSLTTIANYGFYNCSSLKTLDLSGMTVSIGDSAFHNCTSLESIDFSDASITMGSMAFYGCTSLETLDLSDVTMTFNDYAFWRCTNLRTVIIGNNITALGASSFSECSSLETVTITGTVTSVGDHSFYYCSSLRTIIIDSPLESIGDYAFHGCSSIESINIPASVTSVGENTFTCTFKDYDGTTTLEYDQLAGKNFHRVGNVLVRCGMITLRTYGEPIIGTLYGAPGTPVQAPADPVKEHYDFAGWYSDNLLTEEYEFDVYPSGSVTVYAKWTLKNYTVSFMNGDVLFSSYNGTYGDLVVLPVSDPEKAPTSAYTYTFDSWEGYTGGMTVTGPMFFHATYTPTLRQYTITFLNGESVFSSSILYYGDVITAPVAIPAKEADAQYSYTFQSWTGYTADMTVTGPATFNAAYTSTLRQYTITFLNGESVFSSSTLYYGNTISAPVAIPVKESDNVYDYTFQSWQGYTGGMTVTGPMEFSAQYASSLREYTITFLNGESVFSSSTLHYNDDISAPAGTPTRESDVRYSYTFESWTGYTPGMKVTGSASFPASFSSTLREYTIRFTNGDSVVSSNIMHYDDVINAPAITPVKESDVRYSYTFESWTGYTVGMKVTGSVTFPASFKSTLRDYAISFMNGDMTVSSYSLHYGDTILVPAIVPVKASDNVYDYAFQSWEGYTGGMTVSGPIVFHALYTSTLREYTITFLNGESVFSSNKLHYNDDILVPANDPAKESDNMFDYAFESWTGYTPGMKVTGSASFPASFTATLRDYTIKFINGETVISSDVLHYNDVINAPADIPTKESDDLFDYTFESWAGYTAGMKVTGSVTFPASFTKYAITHKDQSGQYHVDVTDSYAIMTEERMDTIVNDAKNDVSVTIAITLGESTVVFDNAAVRTFKTEDAELSLTQLPESDVSESVKQIVGDSPVFSISFGNNTDFGEGKATVTLQYKLSEGRDPANLRIYYISDGKVAEKISCEYKDGNVTFITGHFSDYAIMYEEPSSESSVVNTVIVAAAILIIIGASAFIFLRRR